MWDQQQGTNGSAAQGKTRGAGQRGNQGADASMMNRTVPRASNHVVNHMSGNGAMPAPAAGGPVPADAQGPDALDGLADQLAHGFSDIEDFDELEGLEGADALPPDGPMDAQQRAVWLRVCARKLIREFLRAVPRSEPEATIAIIRPDGVTRILTRAELSAAIDRLRPRQRQILRLGVEERWPRAKVCAYLHNISMKTFERDQVEGLDILIES